MRYEDRGKKPERDVRFAHEKTRIFGAHLPCHPVVLLYGISVPPLFLSRKGRDPG